jgi:hypothetical protein
MSLLTGDGAMGGYVKKLYVHPVFRVDAVRFLAIVAVSKHVELLMLSFVYFISNMNYLHIYWELFFAWDRPDIVDNSKNDSYLKRLGRYGILK